MEPTLLILALALVVTGVALALQATGVVEVTELIGALSGLIVALTAKVRVSKAKREKRAAAMMEADDECADCGRVP